MKKFIALTLSVLMLWIYVNHMRLCRKKSHYEIAAIIISFFVSVERIHKKYATKLHMQ